MRAVEVPCVLNIAAVKLRFKEYDEAIYECNKVLGLEVSVLLLNDQQTMVHAAGRAGVCPGLGDKGAI